VGNMSNNRKALCVGINKFKNLPPSAMLQGCVNDANDMAKLLKELYDFTDADIVQLTDEQATKANIMNNLESMVSDAKAGKIDYLVFSLSSHGTQVPDLSEEESDRADEAFCPYDIAIKGDQWDPDHIIVDDEFNDLFVQLPGNVLLEVFLDTCHSGTGLKAIDMLFDRRPRYLPPPSLTAFEKVDGKHSRGLHQVMTQKKKITPHILWTGCQADQTSADAKIGNEWHGAFTYFFCKAVQATENKLSRSEVLGKLRSGLIEGKYSQIPQLEGEATVRENNKVIIANCGLGLGKFDQECGGYPLIDNQELYNGMPTCKVVDVCGIQAHAGYYSIGSGGNEFEIEIDKYPALHLTMKANKDTNTCLFLTVHDKKPYDHVQRLVAVGMTPKANPGPYNFLNDCFEIKDDGQWHDYTCDLRKLKEDYPDAQSIRTVQFYSYRDCDENSQEFHFSSITLEEVKPTPLKKWTILTYLAGDNNLDTEGVKDLAEMARVGSDDNINIVAQFDRAGTVGTQRFYITKEGGYEKDSIANLGETNCGDPEVLVDFLQWGVNTFPAEHYMVILWNHGSGWREDDIYNRALTLSPEATGISPFETRKISRAKIRRSLFSTSVEEIAKLDGKSRGIAYDDESKDFLDNKELKNALNSALQQSNLDKFDVLGLDACLMNMLEVHYQLKDSVKIVVGSEEVEPGEGWPYDTFIEALANNPHMNAIEVGNTIVEEYIKSYDTGAQSPPVTQSALNLELICGVKDKLDKLTDKLIREIENEFWPITRAFFKSQRYYDYQFLDLYHFAKILGEESSNNEVKTNTQELMKVLNTSLDSYVAASQYLTSEMENSHGVSIYFPQRFKYSHFYDNLDMSIDGKWDEFIKAYQKEYDKN
jgi:hypothetical protein